MDMETDMETAERFYAKVDTSGDCHEWTAYKDRDGYGQFRYLGEQSRAHRVALILTGVDVPDDMCVCHACDNPSCVNPDHLWVGTHLENNQDKANKGRSTHGSRNYFAEICEVDVVLIRDLYASGLKQQAIADWIGISNQSVSVIVTRKAWRRVL